MKRIKELCAVSFIKYIEFGIPLAAPEPKKKKKKKIVTDSILRVVDIGAHLSIRLTEYVIYLFVMLLFVCFECK